MLNRYVWPARHTAGVGSCAGSSSGSQISQSSPPASCTSMVPAGEILRLKPSATLPACVSGGTCPQAAIIITGLQHYGMIMADNGTNGMLIGTPDSRWNDTDLHNLTSLHMSDFEPVNVSSLIVSNDSGQVAVPVPVVPSAVLSGAAVTSGQVVR